MLLTRLLKPSLVAYAHCDLPCGVYDPDQARVEAESVYKTLEKYHASTDEHFKARAIQVKEERAELAKHHIDVLWSDYLDRKSTRLNSSHVAISYAVFC